jgi:hypothetical protein
MSGLLGKILPMFLLVGALAIIIGVLSFSSILTADSGGAAPEAPPNGIDASLGGKPIFPADNPWNRDISSDPVDPNSDALIAEIGADKPLHPDFGSGMWGNTTFGIPYIVIGGNQPRVPVFFDYPTESEPGPYPIPPVAPVEGGPSSSGDRHVIVVDKDNWMLYELFSAYPIDGGKSWKAGSGAIFDLKSNHKRPLGWTSADAAGLPILPGLVRYDEVMELGHIDHALRFTVQRTRRGYVTPARHYASSSDDASLPPMGMRVRLKSSVDPDDFPPAVQVIVKALQKYGMFLADNGSNWYISGTSDPRWNNDVLGSLHNLHGSDFEVIKMPPIQRQD